MKHEYCEHCEHADTSRDNRTIPILGEVMMSSLYALLFVIHRIFLLVSTHFLYMVVMETILYTCIQSFISTCATVSKFDG